MLHEPNNPSPIPPLRCVRNDAEDAYTHTLQRRLHAHSLKAQFTITTETRRGTSVGDDRKRKGKEEEARAAPKGKGKGDAFFASHRRKRSHVFVDCRRGGFDAVFFEGDFDARAMLATDRNLAGHLPPSIYLYAVFGSALLFLPSRAATVLMGF